MLIGGILESITYEGKIEQYMPLIDFCSKAHLGIQTTFNRSVLSKFTEIFSLGAKFNL